MFQQKNHAGAVTPSRVTPAIVGALVALAGAAEGLAQDRNPFAGAAGDLGAEANVEVSEYMTVDLHVQDEDLSNVLQMLSIQSQRNIVMSSDVSATVTANLYDVTFFEALESILNVNGYGFIERGNFIYVYTLEEIAQIEAAARQPVYRVIKLNYLNANDAAEFVAPMLSEIGQIKTNGDPDAFQVPDDAPVGDETYALSAMMVVVDYPENVDEIEKLIAQIDSRPAQVLVEATILQTQLNEANAFGVDFSVIGSLDFTDFTQTGGPLSAAQSLVLGGTGAAGEGVTPADNNGTAVVSSPGNTDGPATFKLGVVSDDFSIFMRLLDEVTDFTVLSNPKVLALNRQPARVLVGRRVGYLNTTSTETSTTQSVEFLDTGTQLAFRPFVSNDGFIRMELKPRVSEGVIRESTDATGANVTIPDEITQELTTNVVVRDGATIVLGGLFKESTTLSRRQVPVLGDIPLVGAAFRGHDDQTSRNEIIFMITPTIVNDNLLIAEGERAMDNVDRVRAGSRKGLLPWSREKMSSRLNVEAERLAAEGNSRKAMWKLRRSLQLNPVQPDALRLREQLFDKYENWPTRSILNDIFDAEYNSRIEELPTVSFFRDGKAGQVAGDEASSNPYPEFATTADVPANSGAFAENADESDVDFEGWILDPEDATAEAVEDGEQSVADGEFEGAGFEIEPIVEPVNEEPPFDSFNEGFENEGEGDYVDPFSHEQPVGQERGGARKPATPQANATKPANTTNKANKTNATTPAQRTQTAGADETSGEIVFDANGLPMTNVAETLPWEPSDYSSVLFFADVQVNGWAPVSVRGLSGLWRYFDDAETTIPAVTTADEKNAN
jgi:type IV pilus assembly protein PilQ